MQTAEIDEPIVIIPENKQKQICDGCGGTVPAFYEASKDSYVLHFCGHHIRKYAEQLKNDGFEITPEDISYDALAVSNSSDDR